MAVGAKEKELERVLKALANRRRLAIVAFLKKQKEASVGRIAEELKLSIKATSKHLTLLAGVGVLDKEQRSTQVFFSVAPDSPEASKRVMHLL